MTKMLSLTLRDLYDGMAWSAARQLPSFSIRDLSSFLWSIAEARHYDREFFNEAAATITGMLPKPDQQQPLGEMWDKM